MDVSKLLMKEKKVEDLSRQLSIQSKRGNLGGMMMTQVKIIQQKEKLNSGTEFYPGFEEDYIALARTLILKRDYGEALTLLEDAVVGASSQQLVLQIKLEIASILLKDPSKTEEEAMEAVEQVFLGASDLTEQQKIQLAYVEALLYYKARDFTESTRLLDEAACQVNKFCSSNKTLAVEINILKVKLAVESRKEQRVIQAMREGREVIESDVEYWKQRVVEHVEFGLIEVEGFIACLDLVNAQSKLIEVEASIEEAGFNDSYFSARFYYLDSQVCMLLENRTQALISIDKSIGVNRLGLVRQTILFGFIQLIQKTRDCGWDFAMSALHQKGVMLAQHEKFDSAMVVFDANAREMEVQGRTRERLYFESLLHLAVMKFLATDHFKVREITETLVKTSNIVYRGDTSSGFVRVLEFHIINEGLGLLKAIDGAILKGMCDIGERSEEVRTAGRTDIQQGCISFKRSHVSQLWVRVLYLNLLKDILTRQKAFQEILYINLLLEEYYFQPRQSFLQENQFKTLRENNIKQTQLIVEMFEIQNSKDK